MSEPRGYSLEAQIACVRRELALRKNVYRRRVGSGAMRAEEAEHELGCMQAVLSSLLTLQPDLFT